MKLLVVALVAIVGLASSRIHEPRWLEEKLPEEFSFSETAFRPSREYQFVYNGQLVTGIPSSSKQHSGTRVQALVSVVFKTSEEALLKVSHIRFGKLNKHIPNPREILPFMFYENVEVQPEHLLKLRLPVKFTWNKGLITDLFFDGEEQPWSANIKRGILNLLQVNLMRRGEVETTEPSVRMTNTLSPVHPTKDFFTVVEPTLEGECETFYTVVSEPNRFYSSGPVMNVTKTINFEKCLKRPHIKYNFRFQDVCPSCDEKFTSEGKFLKASSVFNFNITGTPESFMIERANVESQYIIVPFNEEGNVIVNYVNQTLVLVKSGPVVSGLPEPRNPKPSDSDMIFTPEWDILKEKFFMEGEETFHEITPFSAIPRKVEFVAKLLRKLVSSIHESVETPAPVYFDHLVRFFRLLKKSEIEKVWRVFYVESPKDFTPEEHKKIKNLVVDAIAFAGTKENVFFLVQKIKSRQIPPFQAALLVKSFINIRVVSKEMIQELMTLAESEVVRRHFFLKQSVWLSIGSMMNALCKPSEDLLAMEFKYPQSRHYCPRELKTRFVEKLFEKFRSTTSWEDKVTFLKTISNAGLDVSVFELEKIIKNFEETPIPTFLRVEAVMALRQLKDIMPRKIQKVLMPIFMNRFEAPELRIISAYQIFETLPARPILDQMAKRIFNDPSRQVVSFVFSYMHTMANSTIPCEKRFATDLKLSLRHARFPSFAFMVGYSKLVHKSVFSDKIKSGLGIDLGMLFSNTTYLPKHMALAFNPVFAGFWMKHFTTVGVVSEGFESLFWKYFGEQGFFFEKPLEHFLSRRPRSVRTRSPVQELKDMFTTLRIRPRTYFPNRPRTFFYLKVKNQEMGFLPFSFESLPEEIVTLFQSGSIPYVRTIEKFLETGYTFYFHKALLMHEMSYKIPTTIGFPLQFRITVPTVAKISGNIRGEIDNSNPLKRMKLEFRDFKPSFVSTFISTVQSWTPIVNSGLKVMAQAKFFYPITGKVELDLQKTPIEFKATIEPPNRPVKVLVLETRPVTFTRVWPIELRSWEHPEEKTIQGEDWSRVTKYEKSFGELIFGVNFKVRTHWHRTPFMKQTDTPFCPLSGPNKFVLFTEPGLDMPKEIVFKAESSLFEPLTETFKPELSEFETFEPEYSHEEFSSSLLSSMKRMTPFEPTKHTFRFELLTRGSRTPRFAKLESSIKCGKFMKVCKFNTFFERSPIPQIETEPFKLTFVGETLFPETPMTFTDLVGKKAVASFKIFWGTSRRPTEKFIKLNVIGERSERQVHFERMSPEFRMFNRESEDKTMMSPVFQYEHLYKFAHLLSYKFDLEFSRVPVPVKNLTNFVYRYFKHVYFWQTSVDQITQENTPKRIRAFLTIDPFTTTYFNLTVKTPKERSIFRDIPVALFKTISPVPIGFSPINIRHSRPAFSFLDSVRPMTPFTQRPTCHVSSRYVKTFDSVKYSVPIPTCYTTLAKDCSSEEPRFAILIKKISPESDLKKIKIVTPYKTFTLTPESDSYESVKIHVDGEKFSPESFEPVFDHGHVIARVERLGKYIMFELPEARVQVYFDGFSTNIKMSQMYRNLQCGLCGHFDGETSDEFRLPSNELTSDVKEFFHSYVLKTPKCTVPEFSEFETEPRRFEIPSFEDSEEELSLSPYSSPRHLRPSFPSFDSASPLMRTKVIEQDDEICFSKVPIPSCPHHAHVKTFKPEQSVTYTCLSRDDPLAETYQTRIVERGVIRDLRSLKSSFSEMEVFPEECTPHY